MFRGFFWLRLIMTLLIVGVLVAAGVAPALILGAAIVTRPIEPDVRADGAERPKHGTNRG